MVSTTKAILIIIAAVAGIATIYGTLFGDLDLLEKKSPVAKIDAPSVAPVNTTVTFSGAQSFDDDGIIERYRWIFDDGWKDDRSPIIVRGFEIPRTYTVTLTVFDNDGLSGDWEKFIEIQPHPGEKTLVVSKVRPVDQFGNTVSILPINQQTQIAADLKNISNVTQTFAYVVEIQDHTGEHVSIAWITGSLEPNQSFTPALSWIPQSSGEYAATVSVWDNPDSLIAIANETSIEFSAGE